MNLNQSKEGIWGVWRDEMGEGRNIIIVLFFLKKLEIKLGTFCLISVSNS